jgi:hypothetical protein
MPRANQFFNNLSEEVLLNEADAISVLQDYCDEHNINPILLPNSIINDFVSTVQYAPHTISTDEIARRTGVASYSRPSRPSRPSPSNYPYFTISDVPHGTMQQPRVVEARGDQRRGINFQEVLDNIHSGVLTAQVPHATIDSVEAMTPHLEPTEEELEELLMADLTWSDAPKKKKRKRSEVDMMKEIVRGENFPRPNFRDWDSEREYEEINHDWCANVDYREQWIFSRREREGFNRRNIGYFNLDDVMARMSKRKNPHPLDSSFSKFYDWKLGGTDWILRLELFQHEQHYFLIVRHIHKPTDTELKFDVRYWNGERFKEINSVWCQRKNNDIQFDRVFGSNDENSPYYVRPYVEDDYEPDYDEDYDSEGEYEDSPF